MDQFLLIIIMLSLVAFISICFSKPAEIETDVTGDAETAPGEQNETSPEQEHQVTAT
jgi:hypothetical protein